VTPKEISPEIAAKIINDDAYLRARLQPRPGELTYLHLRDLRSALETIATTEPLRILDFGSGGSPYRPLFPNAQYYRADLTDTPQLDFVIRADSTIDTAGGQFDLILSTQVLEHVANPADYLRECHRLLAPGGRLYLSTHGFYEEHGCPYDFHRWTADGLRLAVEQAGFKTQQVRKLTTSGRALLQLVEHHHGGLFAPRWHPFGLWLAVVRLFTKRGRGLLHRWSDRYHSSQCVVPAEAHGHSFFLGLDIVATKAPL
jgi:SAM-dependent methyltransferase